MRYARYLVWITFAVVLVVVVAKDFTKHERAVSMREISMWQETNLGALIGYHLPKLGQQKLSLDSGWPALGVVPEVWCELGPIQSVVRQTQQTTFGPQVIMMGVGESITLVSRCTTGERIPYWISPDPT